MDAPYYTVEVENITMGWDYSYTHGDVPDPDVEVHLADTLTYKWGFESGVVPGQLTPATGSVGLWCRSAQYVPEVEVGHIIKVTVNIGATGPVILEKHFRVSAAEVTLTPVEDGVDPDVSFAAYLTIDLVDFIAELRSMLVERPLGMPPGTYGGITFSSSRDYAREWWRPRIAEVGVLVDRSIGCPTFWDDFEQPAPMNQDGVPSSGLEAPNGLAFINPEAGNWDGKSAHELIVQLLNSHQPGGHTYSIAPSYAGSYPTGYEYVGTALSEVGLDPTPADPDSDIRYLLVRTSRYYDGHTASEVDVDWCLVPAKARRSREHVINTVRIGGRATLADSGDPDLLYKWTDSALVFTSADATTYAPSARDLPTQLRLHRSPNDNPIDFQPVAPGITAARFLTDSSARGTWVYESFQLVSSAIPQVDAEALLPALAPRVPGETDGDGILLRHITLTNLDPSVDFLAGTIFAPGEPAGFLVAGQLTITDGDLIWNLTLTPGEPQ